MIVDTDDILDLFGISDKDIYAKETIEDAIYDGTLHQVEPERERGKWIDGYRRQTCSACRQKGYRSWNFCPNCGADMTKDGDE